MKYVSERGEFDSMQILVAAYLGSRDGGAYELSSSPFCRNEWEPDVLHASEVGSCPRAVAYRLSHEEEKPRGQASAANRAVMFDAAYFFHYRRYSSLNWAGLLVGHEEPVPLPDGWTGRYDAIFKPDYREERTILYDLKSVLPNALKYSYDMPKEKDGCQLCVYANALDMKEAMVEYADRAGSVTPLECPINPDDYLKQTMAAMAALEKARDELPYLPEILPPVYVGSYWKRRGANYRDLKTVSYQPDWRCSYCAYHLHLKDTGTHSESSCKPYFKPPEVVAEFKQGRLIRVTKGHEDAVDKWLGSHITSYQIEEEESP